MLCDSDQLLSFSREYFSQSAKPIVYAKRRVRSGHIILILAYKSASDRLTEYIQSMCEY